jgi:hypothetical protein
MNVDLSPKDVQFFNMILNKELGDTRVEIIHTDNGEYKNCLKEREEQIKSLIEQFSKLPVPETGPEC